MRGKETKITLFGGKIAGWVYEDSSGNKEAVSFGGKTVGRYKKATNTTTNKYGQIVAYGDCVAGLLLPPSIRG